MLTHEYITLREISIRTRAERNERQLGWPLTPVVLPPFYMKMSVQKKFLCGFGCFVLFIGLVGFFIGFFARPNSDSRSCYGAKNENDGTSGMLVYEKEALELVLAQRIHHYLK